MGDDVGCLGFKKNQHCIRNSVVSGGVISRFLCICILLLQHQSSFQNRLHTIFKHTSLLLPVDRDIQHSDYQQIIAFKYLVPYPCLAVCIPLPCCVVNFDNGRCEGMQLEDAR